LVKNGLNDREEWEGDRSCRIPVQIEWDGRYGPSKFGKILNSAERWRHM